MPSKPALEMISEGGVKNDAGKPRLGLLPSAALTEIAQVFTYGAHKYAEHNWRRGLKWSRLYDALQRHLTAWNEGEETDPESDLPHLAHAGCCLLMLLAYGADPAVYSQLDDRWSREPAEHTPRPRKGC